MDQSDTRALFSALAAELAGMMETVEGLSSLAAEHARQTPADRRAAVCEAIRDKDVEYVLDFGDREVHGAEHEFPGLERLASSSAVEEVDSEGGAVLYRVTGCEVQG